MDLKFFNIAESLTSAYPYTWKRKEPAVYTARFTNSNRDSIYVNIDYRSEGVYEVDFTSYGNFEMTNAGDSLKVLATVMSVIKEFVKERYDNIRELHFSSVKDDYDAKDKRGSVYEALLYRFVDKSKWNVKIHRHSEHTAFDIIKKDPKWVSPVA